MNAEMDGKHQVLPEQQLGKNLEGVGGGLTWKMLVVWVVVVVVVGRWGGVDVLFG